MTARSQLTQEKLKSIVNYDPQTGFFTWRANLANGFQAGERTGYLNKSRDGYSLQVCDLEDHEKAHLLDWMFKYDPIATDLLLDRMQDLINERIPFVEARENVNRGLRPVHDNQTGEVSWVTNNVSGF